MIEEYPPKKERQSITSLPKLVSISAEIVAWRGYLSGQT